MNRITSIKEYFKALRNNQVIIHISIFRNSEAALEGLAMDYTSLGIYFAQIDGLELESLQLPLGKVDSLPCTIYLKDGIELGRTKGDHIGTIESVILNYFLC